MTGTREATPEADGTGTDGTDCGSDCGTRASSTSQSKRAAFPGSAGRSSGCHWTPMMRVPPNPSIASTVAVIGPAHHPQPGTHGADGLVVERVHAEQVETGRLPQQAVLEHPDAVDRHGALPVLTEAVGELGDIGKVLDQRAAGGDVDHLAAAADAEDGDAVGEGGPHERQLPSVALGVDPLHLGREEPAVPPGVDVATAAEEEPVEARHRRFRLLRVEHRQHQRHPSGHDDGGDVGPVERLQQPVLVHASASS